MSLSHVVAQKKTLIQSVNKVDLEELFLHPPASAKPGVLWMWMGTNISKEGITKDLEALKEQGFNRTTMFSLADITTPWAMEIQNSPTPNIIAWTAPWWQLVRHAALESKRLGMDFGMFNGPAYESSGGRWISPELSMQELVWSIDIVDGNQQKQIVLNKPQVSLKGHLSRGSFLKTFPQWFVNNTQRPYSGRYCFTTWNYFNSNAPLVNSGLLGPVQILMEE